MPPSPCAIIPPYLLDRLAQFGPGRYEQASAAARRTLGIDPGFREVRAPGSTATTAAEPARSVDASVRRRVFDAQQRESLPGVLVRSEGEPDTADIAVTQAYDGMGQTHALFAQEFGRNSIDDAGQVLDASVHYGQRYDNAFWDGTRMVFGDGDGEVFTGFTSSLSIIGHELAHGVTERTAALVYRGQSGALNEHVSDVFGALVEQHVRRQSATQATWLIGEGIFSDAVQGSAIRSMRAPGTAYDDDVLGKDPQPAHMDDYVETAEDNGGVHINSGIANRAFVVVAETIGGHAWERAGRIWYDALTGGALPGTATFAQFVDVTLAVAASRFGDGSSEHDAVAAGWRSVGLASG